MKKLFVLLLSAVILLNGASCTGGDTTTAPESAEETAADTVKETDFVTEEETEADTNAVTDEVTDAETEAVTDAETEAEEEKELSLGNVNGNTYKNDFIGIGCTIGDGWVFYNDEQIAQINGITQSYLDEDYLEQMKNATVFYDMYASSESSSTINISLEKGTKLAVLLTDIDKVLTNSVGSIESSFANMGGTNFKYELRDVEIDGETFKGMDMYVEINGVPVYETMFCIKANEYLVYACVCTYIENTTDDILGTFFIVE